jgi:hypothetical protein
VTFGVAIGTWANFFEEEFLSTPIHSPLSGRQSDPSIGIKVGYGSS